MDLKLFYFHVTKSVFNQLHCRIQQYLDNKSLNILVFLNRDSHQEKATHESTSFSCTWSGMPSHVWTCEDLSDVFLGNLRATARLKIVQNERLFYKRMVVFMPLFLIQKLELKNKKNKVKQKLKTKMLLLNCISGSFII